MGVNIMNSLYMLTTSSSIGNTLSTLNQNSYELDKLVSSIQLSAQKFWIPMAQYYEERKTFLKEATKEVASNFPRWQTASTTFEANSAKWITPITVFYPYTEGPNIALYQPNVIQTRFKNWLDVYYPIFRKTSPLPYYVEGQRIIIYSFNLENSQAINSTFTLNDSTVCTSAPVRVCAYCSQCFTSYVPCQQGTFWCDGRGCSYCHRCGSLNCNFSKTNTTSKASYIRTHMIVNLANSHEKSEMNAFVFMVKDCQWVFEKTLTRL
jgi:hypothetical protein